MKSNTRPKFFNCSDNLKMGKNRTTNNLAMCLPKHLVVKNVDVGLHKEKESLLRRKFLEIFLEKFPYGRSIVFL